MGDKIDIVRFQLLPFCNVFAIIEKRISLLTCLKFFCSYRPKYSSNISSVLSSCKIVYHVEDVCLNGAILRGKGEGLVVKVGTRRSAESIWVLRVRSSERRSYYSF